MQKIILVIIANYLDDHIKNILHQINKGDVHNIRFSHDGTKIIAVGRDKSISVTNFITREVILSIPNAYGGKLYNQN